MSSPLVPGVGELFEAEVDRAAWRRTLRPWSAGGVAGVVVGVGLVVVGWPWPVLGWVVVGAVVLVVGAKVAGYVARRKRRATSLTVDRVGVRVPTGRGPVFLPWESLRSVVVDGVTLRFRVRPAITPGSPGVLGLHRRDAWPVASGPGLPVDTRLFTRELTEIVAAVRLYSGDCVRIADA
ncbi:hypothetical protein [Actinokineospora spheciospongiae]|uniref:hypothetical protein n=1 Tax=Actinokineospora spheciospongiae TaxID=909613 RepID=UPI000556EBF0|nr:hypothetical protein [Actinokineospora spheciospongiae]